MSKEHFINAATGLVDTLESNTKILGLFGKYRPLSNFHAQTVEVDGYTYKCSEAAYMAEKTLSPFQKDKLQYMNGLEAKRYGQEVMLIPNWDSVKYFAMLKVLRAKFSQCEYLKELLLSTGDKYIEETNWWKDTYWGVCDRIGYNKLGQILMLVRQEYRGKSGDGSLS